MRLILPAGCILVLTVLVCGCIQSPSALPVTPSGTSSITVITPAETTATPSLRREVNISAEETLNSVIVQVDGGNDAGSLTSLSVRISNQDGSTIQRTIPSPVIEKPYVFTYRGYANAVNINVVGTFSDGHQQTLLMTSL